MTIATNRPRRRFDSSFNAVQMVREQNLSVRQVCEDLSLDAASLRRWLVQYDAEHARLLPVAAHTAAAGLAPRCTRGWVSECDTSIETWVL